MEENNTDTCHRANGESIPTVSLHRYLEKRLQPSSFSLPCSLIGIAKPGRVADILDDAGTLRFKLNVDGFRAELSGTDAGQTLYRGIMTALGYSKNKVPCKKLAGIIPLRNLETIASSTLPEEDCLLRLQSLLFGAAGLLPSQRTISRSPNTDEYINSLEKLWSEQYRQEVLPPRSWNLFKVRPHNSPLRRLAALSYLIMRCRTDGLLNSFRNLFEVDNYKQLIGGLIVEADGYWAEHYDFGKNNRLLSKTLIGPDRAGEIIINIVLPFMDAYSRLGEKAREIYNKFPLLTTNSIEKHVKKQLKIDKKTINSARRQQGLIHIYKTLCTQGKCVECPINKCN